jgi:uncharacterized membrane protein
MMSTASSIENAIVILVQWLKLGVETVGATLVLLGVCVAVVQLIRPALLRQASQFTTVRLILARYLALAIEFELGADILGTAISPTWNQIGKLGAIAVIRTGLNFFLSAELKQETTVTAHEAAMTGRSSRRERESE